MSLPDSGDGRPPPRADALPHPELWRDPALGQQARAYGGVADEDPRTPRRTRGRVRAAWVAVGALILGAVLVAVAFVLVSVPVGVAGVVLGLAGAVLAVRSKIMSVVTVGQSPEGSDHPGSPG